MFFVVKLHMRRRVGMADEADSKSVVGNHVRVQVPLPAFIITTGQAQRGLPLSRSENNIV